MYLFFVRAFNDIDHMTPIVWKMNQDGYPVSVYCINPEYDIQNDYRLTFLRTSGIKVNYLYNDFSDKLGYLHRFIRSVMFSSYRLHKKLTGRYRSSLSPLVGVLGKFAREIGKLSYASLKTLFYRKAWAHGILKEANAKALCFDHIRPRQYSVNILLTAAKEKSIPTIALPHGVYIYLNEMVKARATEKRAYEKYNQFDYIVTQNHLRKENLVDAGVQRDKIQVLGSARYCDKWMEQNKRILPRLMTAKDQHNNELKAVFMTTRFDYRIDIDRLKKTFDLLSKMNGIEAVVKPHTRTGKEAGFYDDLPLKNATDISSVELCEWADVILVIASSIIIEGLMQGKPALYLKYLHANSTQYEELGACWMIQNETELKNALIILRNDKTKVPYSADQINKFLSEIVYGGLGKRDVLHDYEQFIVNCTQSRITKFTH